jgi:hypothetical protein
MSTNPLRNPRTVDEARTFVARVEAMFMLWNIPALLAGFTDNCIVRFGDMPEFRGRAAWVMRDGRIAVGEAAFNINEVGKPSAMGLI